MWLSTTTGFFSIVQHRDAPDQFLVRARVENDLHDLKTLAVLAGEIIASPQADYPFRIYISGAELLTVMARLAEGITYPNFKSRIAQLPGQRSKLDAYHKVWAVMQDCEDEAAR